MEANGNGTPAFQVTNSPQSKGGGNRGLRQAYLLRDTAASEVLALREEPSLPGMEDKVMRARALRDLTAVWANASERIRILRGRPLPGSLKPKSPTRKKAQRTGPLFSDTSASTDSANGLPGPGPETP